MDVTFSYNDVGKLSKIVIKPNQLENESKLPDVIKREEVLAVIDEIVPEYERGARVRHLKGISFGRAAGEIIVYENAQIDLTLICRNDNCGVTYAEVRFKNLLE
jgi:hypothetical protein